MEFFSRVWSEILAFCQAHIREPFKHIGVLDVIDLLVLALVLFEIYRFARTRRAGRVLVGLLAVIVASLLVTLLELPALTYIVRLCASAAFFCIVLIFQPEIREALERLGNGRMLAPRGDSLPKKQLPAARQITEETVDAVFKMAETKTGALIVFEGLTKLGEYAEVGKLVDARVTSHLLQTIFFDKSPLHDGALVIRDMKIWKAGCVLPSTQSDMDFGTMGTRHRAAVGVTEVSDALVVVVSEQSGVVSVAQEGKMIRNLDPEALTDILLTYLAGSLYIRLKKQQAKAARAASELAEKTAQVVAEIRHTDEMRHSEAQELQESNEGEEEPDSKD